MDEASGGQDERIQTRVVKEGSYGKVRLVAGSSQSGAQALEYKKKVWTEKIGDFFKGARRSTLGEAFEVARIAIKIFPEGQVFEDDVRRLPQGLGRGDLFKYANIFAVVIDNWNKAAMGLQRQYGEKLEYSLGLVLSDLLEVLPRDVAARMLFAISNPGISESILKGQGNLTIQHIDVMPVAVETVVLLPKEARHEIFEEMARLQPGRVGQAHRFFSLIAANWGARNSEYCGPILIYQNLKGEVASEKVLEVQADLAELGPLVRGERASGV